MHEPSMAAGFLTPCCSHNLFYIVLRQQTVPCWQKQRPVLVIGAIIATYRQDGPFYSSHS
jgi:hypothetical protein